MKTIKLLYLLLLLLPTAGQGQFTFTTNNGTITITEYTGTDAVATVPATTNGLPVTSIGNDAFFGITNLTTATIGDSVTNIGQSAFSECSNLTAVYFQGNAPSLGLNVFGGDTNASVYYLSGTTGWGSTFGGLPAVLLPFSYMINGDTITINGYTGSGGAVTIPNAINGLPVTWIADNTFNPGGISVTSIIVPNTITNLGDDAFFGCFNVTEFYFLGNAPSIGSYIFEEVDSATIYYQPGTTGWDTTLGGLPTVLFPFIYTTNNDTITIAGYTGAGGDVTVPTSIIGLPVTQIGDYAFQNCTNLTSITIPDSVTSIGNYAFSNCLSLAYVTIGSGLTSMGDGSFTSCGVLTAAYFAGNAPAFGSDLFTGDDNAIVYYLPETTGWGTIFAGRPTILVQFNFTVANGTVTITGYTGAGGDVTIPANINGLPVSTIGNNAFQYCSNLTSITIPDSVTILGDNAFSFCTDLSNVSIGTNVNSIGFWTFYSCNSLTNIAIPDSVTTIGDYAFQFCGSLTSVTIGNGITSVGDWAFSADGALTSILFKGNGPGFGSYFTLYDQNVILYYLPGAIGWETSNSALCKQWNPVGSVGELSSMPQTNGFGFNITGTADIPIVIEASTDLGSAWIPLQTFTLTNGSVYFTDLQSTNYLSRFYRFRFP